MIKIRVTRLREKMETLQEIMNRKEGKRKTLERHLAATAQKVKVLRHRMEIHRLTDKHLTGIHLRTRILTEMEQTKIRFWMNRIRL